MPQCFDCVSAAHPSSQSRASRLGFALLGQAYHRRFAAVQLRALAH